MSVSIWYSKQARNQGGCTGCVRTPPQAPKVHILILNIQVKECGRLNWSFKLNSDDDDDDDDETFI